MLVGDAAVADRNPIDLTLAGIQDEVYRSTIAALLDSPNYDGLVVVVGASGLAQPELAARPILAAAPHTSKPVAVYVSPHALNIVRHLNQQGVPAFDTPEGCAAALAAMWHQRPTDPLRQAGAAGATHASGALDEVASKALFTEYGIPGVREQVVATPEEAARAAHALGGPVVLKVRGVAHKTEVGGVQLNLRPDEVAAACASMPSPQGWVVQQQVTRGVEMLLGLTRDPQLGLAIMLGAGGIWSEVFEDTAVRLLPLRPGDPEAMLQPLKVRRLLEGFRGRPRADVPALFQAIHAFAAMAEALDERLLEAEINPLFVLPEGEGVLAADGLVVLR
jgi:acyl-CoA synthetase (NDP forming)